MSDISTDTTTPATDMELVQIEVQARGTTVMHWPELVRTINRLRQAEAENDRLREALTKAHDVLMDVPHRGSDAVRVLTLITEIRAALAKEAGG